MNKSQAVKWKGQAFRFRPIAIQTTEFDERLQQHDDAWAVVDVSDTAATVSNVRTGHDGVLGSTMAASSELLTSCSSDAS